MDEATAWKVLVEAQRKDYEDKGESIAVFVGTEKEVAAFERICHALEHLDTESDMISEEKLVAALREKR